MAYLASTAARVMLVAPAMTAVTEALTVARINASRLIPRPPAACPGPPFSLGPRTSFPPPLPPGPPSTPPLPPLLPIDPTPYLGTIHEGVPSWSSCCSAWHVTIAAIRRLLRKFFQCGRRGGHGGSPAESEYQGRRGTLFDDEGWRFDVGQTHSRCSCIVDCRGRCCSGFLIRGLVVGARSTCGAAVAEAERGA